MQRYFLKEFNQKITGQDAHHIKKVMRMKVSDDIICCAEGRCFYAEIPTIDQDVTYQLKEELKKPNTWDVTLIQGLPKHPKSEIVVKQATIFGAKHIMLAGMKRSIAKLENESNKLQRYETISKEGAELAHRFDIPKIELYKSLSSIDFKNYDLIILADENEHQKPLREVIQKKHADLKIAIIIGPEGGISDDERTYLIHQKAITVSLGKHILPTELASLYVLSYISAIFS
jgi:16S rRNA (uracil1498-N3)-methyltransferase